ncbi:MAG: NADH-quinone oxidoreductase subunit C [Propionibacteriaceae bacterium]|nr:NADH-quinone oxidoreductase subunit C [Propionibacteriaceae bacterium]
MSETPTQGQLAQVAGAVPTIIDTQKGMWGEPGQDVSGFSDLTRQFDMPGQVAPPLDGWFGVVDDLITDQLPDAVEARFIDRDELTLRVRPAYLTALARILRDDPYLRFEVCSSVSGVHYPQQVGAQLHAVYHLLSITHNRRLRLEVAVPDENPHIPSVTRTWPMANYHERETYDMFGIIFDGHPSLTRLLMPDDWVGYPQRKDYPLGGVDVQFKGARVAPPDRRRSYAR